MSEPVRIGLVAEGITDFVVVNAAIEAMLKGRPFVLKLLQPEASVAFFGTGDAGQHGGGWKGVWSWCSQARQRSGNLATDISLELYDLFVIHLDADVADEEPEATSPIKGLPCSLPCPPAVATTNELRRVLLQWTGDSRLPPKTVVCIPSKSTEAWVIEALFPYDKVWKKHGECLPDPSSRLGQQPLLKRLQKSKADFEKHGPQIQMSWPLVVARLGEAARFQSDFAAALAACSE